MNPLNPEKRVLVVDDEAPILVLAGRFLSKAGFSVACAQNGQEALDQFRTAEWNVVVTDRAMPGVGGEELARQMKAIDPGIRLVLMSGNLPAAEDYRNFDAVLTKPFSMPQLLEVVERVSAGTVPTPCRN